MIVGAVVAIILLSVAGTLLVQHLLTKLESRNRGCGKDVDTCSKEKCIALHKKDRTYLIIIFGIIMMFILVDLFVGDKDALNYFSFASTIASIILSVLAIMMTIFSDAKNENTKALINKSVQSLESTAKDIQSYTNSFKEKSEAQKETFERILETSRQTLDLAREIQSGVNAMTLKSESKTVKATEYEAMQYKLENIGEKQ